MDRFEIDDRGIAAIGQRVEPIAPGRVGPGLERTVQLGPISRVQIVLQVDGLA